MVGWGVSPCLCVVTSSSFLLLSTSSFLCVLPTFFYFIFCSISIMDFAPLSPLRPRKVRRKITLLFPSEEFLIIDSLFPSFFLLF